MPKKWTMEQRKAASEKAKAAIARKKAANLVSLEQTAGESDQPAEPTFEDVANASIEPADPGPQNVEIGDILRRLQEMEQREQYWRQQATQPQTQGPAVGANGLIGSIEKYKLDPKYYPDPRERLSLEGRLKRFAFPENYELEWNVGVSQYRTIDNVYVREPKFTLELNRIMLDELTGEPTNGRYTICRMIFHEDPDAALVVAREQGVRVEDFEEKAFLDEMRYLRMRDWLLEAFYPPRPSQEKKNKREMAINGKLVEYFEINSESSEPMPFGELKSKL